MVPAGLEGEATIRPSGGDGSRLQQRRRRLESRVETRLDPDDVEIQRAQDVAVGRIARIGQRDPLASIENRQKRQDEAAGRSRRHHDAVGIDRAAVPVLIVPGDPAAQAGQPHGVGIADQVPVQRRAGGGQRSVGRRGARLADLQVQDVATGSLALVGRTHHVHDDEGWDAPAPGDLQDHDGSPFPSLERSGRYWTRTARPWPRRSLAAWQLTVSLRRPAGHSRALARPTPGSTCRLWPRRRRASTVPASRLGS